MMRFSFWNAPLAGSVAARRRARHYHRLQPRARSKRGRIAPVAAAARIEVLEDRALLSGAPSGSSTLPTLSPAQQTALDKYVAAPDSSYSFSLNSTLTGPGYTDYVVNMVSQTWTPSPGDSQVWQHWLQIIVPTTVTSKTAVLSINGGSNGQAAPTTPDQLSLVTATTLNAITVFLPNIPNEPVTFPAQGETTPLTEDQIVAFTFEQFLNGNGQDWPLLLPMVKSAVRAMDTTQSFVSSQSGGALSVDNFIVTGASKRGWTTWLTPAVDTRVLAIVPFVFDGLNLSNQVESQLDTYVDVTQDVFEGDSTAVQDYVGDGVFNFFGMPQMAALNSIVDPYSYIDRSTYDIPKYMIDSTGDQFFVPDAQFFFNDLPGQNYLRYVPNTDHGLNNDAVVGAINFEKAFLDGATLPQFTWTVSNSGTQIELNSATTPTSVTMWQATNPTNRDFRLETFGAGWTSSTLTDQGGGTYIANVTPPSTGATDFFIQMQYTVDGVTLTFTTQISTVPLLTPSVVVTDATDNFNGSPFAATATATGRAGLPVPGTFSFDYYNGVNPIGTPFTTPPTHPGTYTVVASFTSSDPDYATGQSSPVFFTIEKAVPKFSITDNGGSYNDSPYVATATIAGVVSGVDDTPGSSLEGVALQVQYFAGPNPTGTPLTAPPIQAGQYTALAFFPGSTDYGASEATPARFTIAKDRAVITLTDAGGPYNNTPYPATDSIAGVVAGVDDTAGSSLEGVPLQLIYFAGPNATGGTLPGPPTQAGQYTVRAEFAGSADYESDLRDVFITITQLRPTLNLADAGGPYTGAPYPATASIAGLIPGVDDTPSSSLEGVGFQVFYYAGPNPQGSPLSGPPTQPGQYAVVMTFAGSQDYFATSVDLVGVTISKALPVISLADAGGAYNANSYPATATVAGVVSGVDDTPGNSLENVDLALSYFVGPNPDGTQLSGPPVHAGQYTALASFVGSADYQASQTSATFTISQLIPTMTLSAPGGTYNGNAFPATGTVAGDVAGVDDTPGPTLEGIAPTFIYYTGTEPNGTPSSTPPTDAGNYIAEENFIGSEDYRAVVEDQPFRILQATPTVTALDAGGNFNGNPFPATGKVAGVGGATVDGNLSFTYFPGSNTSGVPSATAPISPGTYTVVASFLSSDPNYVSDTTSTPVTFVIDPLPVINAPANVSVNQNGSLTLTAPNTISVTDAAGTGNNSETLTLGVASGTLTFGTTTGLTITGNGSGSVSVSGPLASLNSDLATLVYAPTSGFSGSDTLNLAILDTTDQAQGSPAKVAIAVNPLSALPSITAPATASVAENTFLVFSSANKNAITVTDASAGSNLEQITLSVTHGTIKLGSTTGLTFVAGSNNSASMTIKGTLANLNADLNGLMFTPTVGYFGPASLSVTFKDLVSNQTASATVAITVIAPASTVTASIKTPLPIAVPFEPVPFLIAVSDTNAAAQAAPFTINLNWGDGNTANFSWKSPLVLVHIFTRPGTYTITVTATDEYGHTSAPATVTIRVLFVFVGFNPFNPRQTALFVGGTGANDAVSFTSAGSGGIAVSLNGVAQGVFNTAGPLIVFTGGATDSVTKGVGVNAALYVAQNPTDYNLEADLEAQANGGTSLNPFGFNAAMEVLAY